MTRNEHRFYVVLTISGGKTSAYQAIWCTRNKDKVAEFFMVPEASVEFIYLFCNAGRENDETLRFVNHLDVTYFNNEITWLEANVKKEKGKGTRHSVVSYKNAHKTGEYRTREETHPFMNYIRKYGIPNLHFKSCTRELKIRPQESYMRSLGFKTGEKSRNYWTAVGIRTDEDHRRGSDVEVKKLKNFYPLLDLHESDKEDVELFWEDDPQGLNLKSYRGNCDTCFKKSKNKLNMVYIEEPESFEFNRYIEKYNMVGAEFEKGCLTPRKQFRELRNTEELIAVFRPWEEVKNIKHFVRDTPGGCGEECGVSSDDTDRLL